ncbi:MAG: Tryptophan synthase alpha chain [Acidobacteriales bacterium]|nr:Tryptophan synthase alpha chain [Terriglobales bacterium]
MVYVTCGDPDLETTREVVIAAIDAGADVIELGVPFSDPVADGPVIQRASERAVKNGTSMRDVLRLAAEVRTARAEAGLIIFSYLNPILRFGVQQFASEAKRAGVDGVLVTDMTVEESHMYSAIMHSQSLATIFLAAPTSTDARLKIIAKASSGFIYAVSRTGVTGTKLQSDVKGDAQQLVRRLKKISKLPVAVGFGISSVEDFRAVGTYADAAVVGSAIVKIIEENSDSKQKAAAAVARWIRSLTSNKTAAKA